MQDHLLEVSNVTKIMGKRKILNQVSFNVKKGSICGFIGANGAGKTTTIRIITGLMKPTAGTVRIDQHDVHKDRKNALQKLGAIVETPIFFSYMSGRKNLLNLARLHAHLDSHQQKEKVDEVLRIVDLTDRADDKVKTYSLGMKQRLGIAQALLGDPEIIILDEPANGLDPMGMRELRELILGLSREHKITFLISSHLLDELQKMCDHLVVIHKGSIAWTGELKDVMASQYHNIEDFLIAVTR